MEKIPENPLEKKKNGPDIRVIGGVPEKTKKIIKETYEGYFGEKHFSDLPDSVREVMESYELPKTAEQLEMIDFANKKTNELMEECGVEPYDVPYKNIHSVPGDIFEYMLSGEDCSQWGAATNYKEQGAVFDADKIDNPFIYGKTSFHEFLHLKNKNSIEVKIITEKEEDEEEESGGLYGKFSRTGLLVGSSLALDEAGESHEHFRGLDEAVVSFGEKKFAEEMLSLPLFEEEKKRQTSSEFFETRKKYSQENDVPEEEVLWISEDGKKVSISSYRHQRKVYNYVLEEIQKEFPEKYEDINDVHLEFLKSMFTGNLLGVGRLVEKTFGKGSFRTLGIMGGDSKSQNNILESLRKSRSINKGKK